LIPGVNRPLLVSLLVAAALAIAPTTAFAETPGQIPTISKPECTPSLIEGQTWAENCMLTIENTPTTFGPTAVGFPPTGSLTVNGVPLCTLVVASEVFSRCPWSTTVTWGNLFHVEIAYSGDELHGPTLSTADLQGPGYPVFPPEIPARAPTAAEAAEHTVTGIPIPETRIVAQPAKLTHAHLATFRFAGGEQYECALDQGTFHPSAASFSRHVATGRHVLRVRQSDSAPPAVYRWRVLPRRG
jgi:hypothetical protein